MELVERLLPVGSEIERAGSPDASFRLAVAGNGAADDGRHSLYGDAVLLKSSADLGRLLQRLESELHFAVASNARSSLFVHAGVVGWRGRAILLPGPSMSGKSSLVAALLRAGAVYYSDEYAVVDAQGHVHPYAKPIGLRVPGGRRRPTSAEPVGCQVGGPPLPAGLIVSTSYSRGARFEPGVRGPSHGLMMLVANTVLIRERPRFALDHLMPAVAGATILAGVRGDADEAAAWLLRERQEA